MISVYDSNERLFKTNGIKILKPLQAIVTKEDNGDYFIELKDTIDNLNYYQAGLIVRVPTPWGYQGFRLTNPKTSKRILTCKGYHLFFDTKNYLIKDSYVVDKNCNDSLDHLNNACDSVTPFTVLSDVSTISSYRCVRKTFEEAIVVVLERWGGHLVRDNFKIEIRNEIGEDRGITLRSGKNIEELSTSENWDNVVTKILPVGKDGLLLPEVYIELEEKIYDIPYSKIISFNQDISEDDYKDSEGNVDNDKYQNALINDLRAKANEYLQENKLPKINYTLSAYLKDVSDVGDKIHVLHPKCHVDITTNVISIEYDCIQEKYTKIQFGNFKNKLKDLIPKISSSITDEFKVSTEEQYGKLQKELEEATKEINSSMSTSYVIYDGSKILVLDNLPAENAKNVILINNGGIGFSQNGINGTFKSAWSIDGTFNMQNINVINLVADMIKGGTLKLGSNLGEEGKMELYDEANKLISSFDKTGLTFFNHDNSYIKINPEVGFAGYDPDGNKTYWVDGDEFHQKKSVVEEEITIASKLRMIPIETDTNNGIGLVSLIGGDRDG